MRSKVISLSASGLSLCVYLKRRLHAGRVKGQHSLYLESRVRPSVHAFSTTVVTRQLRNARRALGSAAQRSTVFLLPHTPPPSSLLPLLPPLPSLSPFHPSLCCTSPPPNLNAGSDLVPALTHSLTHSVSHLPCLPAQSGNLHCGDILLGHEERNHLGVVSASR